MAVLSSLIGAFGNCHAPGAVPEVESAWLYKIATNACLDAIRAYAVVTGTMGSGTVIAGVDGAVGGGSVVAGCLSVCATAAGHSSRRSRP